MPAQSGTSKPTEQNPTSTAPESASAPATPTDKKLKADVPTADVAMVNGTVERASVECTPVQAPLEKAAARDNSQKHAHIEKVLAPIKSRPI